jgi:predicted nucleic acid-binding protein
VIIVIDASVAVKWVLREVNSGAADALLDDHDLIAPVLWLAEAGNALWRRQRIGEITADEADVRLSALLNAPLTSQPLEPILPAAVKIAIEIGHPIYDCLYLALAQRHQTHVITADRRFVSAVNSSRFSGTVRLLGT